MNNPGQGGFPYNDDIYPYSAAASNHQTEAQGHPRQDQVATQPEAFHFTSENFSTQADTVYGVTAQPMQHHAAPSQSFQISSVDPLPSSQYIPQFTTSQLHDFGHFMQPHTQPYIDPLLQLELLRETRKIRELEHSIAVEKRRSDEAIMRQRQAELALANLDHSTDYTHVDDSRSTSSHQQRDALLSDTWPFASHPAPVEPPLSAAGSSSNPDVSSLETTPDFRPTSASRSLHLQQDLSPSRGLSSSKVSTSTAPRQFKSKRKMAVIEEREIHCSSCSRLMAKVLLHGTRNELHAPYRPQFRCNDCMDPDDQSTLSGSSSKKRGNELEDTTVTTICIVCSRGQGQGGFVSKDREPLQFTYNAICISCSEKYKRCSNCGGKSNRVVTGKWRCKEMFVDGRKTCCVNHDRLGARDMEMSIWDVPGHVSDRTEYPEMVQACINLWRDHQLSKLATPEVLEHSPDLQTYDDILNRIIDKGPPAKVLLTEPPLTSDHRHIIALTWAKARRRRDKSKPQWTKSSISEKSIEEWVAFNTRKSEVLVPSNSILAGMWFFEWHIRNRTVLCGTITMYDRAEVDERGIFSQTRVLLRILSDIEKHNIENPTDPWHPPEHIWIAIKVPRSDPQTRLYELLEQRLGMLPLDKYTSRHPLVDPAIFDTESSRIATHVSQRIPGDSSITVFVKNFGGKIGVECIENVMKRELGKIPKNVEV